MNWLRHTWFRHLLTLRPMWEWDFYCTAERDASHEVWCSWRRRGGVRLHFGPFYWDGEPGGHINHAGIRAFGRRIGIRDTN